MQKIEFYLVSVCRNSDLSLVHPSCFTKIAEEQCGFEEGKGTTNTIYIHGTIIEQAAEVQEEFFVLH